MAPTPKTPEELRRDIISRINYLKLQVESIGLKLPVEAGPLRDIRSALHRASMEINKVRSLLP